MWTRNYNNLLNTVITNVSEGYNGASPHPFGDTYTGNFKNALGNIYEICTYNTTNNAPLTWIARAPLAYRKSGTAVSTEIALLTNVQSGLQSESGHHKGKIFVAFGVSDDEETYEDYRLDDVITNFILNNSTATATENGDGTLTINYHLMLTATADFVIREIGLFLPIPYHPTSASNITYGYYALVNRMVLDKAISAVKDEVVHVNFSITTPKISVAG